ncbi:MAG: hypothetical protein OEN50_13315 [Deltaproteobacteria bacterium]|nr:hypothetical protein [Deltaproteobacteria bacterium]
MNYHQLKSDFVNLNSILSLAAALPRFFRERITLQQAEEEVKRLLATQVARFLEMACAQIYQRPGSPYSRLLKYAGCEFADLENSMNRHGLENTLAKLAGEGVFLTSDEFKGKTEVVRGGLSFRVSPKDFERRDSSAGFTMESSGTRNRPVATFNPLDWRALQVNGEAVFYSGHDLFSCVHAICEPVLAGRMTFILKHGKLGIPTDRWFALDVAAHGPVEERFHFLTASLVSKMGNWFGPGIARPEYLGLSDLKPIVDWIQETKRKEQHPCVTTVVSNAIRIARTATETGLSLEGVTLHVSGEPLTQFKKRLLEEAGARIVLHYGPGGGVGSALGCGNAQLFDEMHIPQTMFTLIENPRTVDYGESAIHPLMLTTLHLAAPRFLFNVENGDYATMLTRDCGCPLQKVGFTRHIHTVRSFEKMTSEGMNYSGADLFELLENTIPSEFGGGPGDYQLVEEEDIDGQTRLTMVVHPGVGQLDEDKLLFRLQQGLGRESRNHRFMSRIWQEAGAFRIRRALPHASARGKILPLHIKQKN